MSKLFARLRTTVILVSFLVHASQVRLKRLMRLKDDRFVVVPDSYRNHTSFQVTGDGSCMTYSIREQFAFKTSMDRQRYKEEHLRRQVIAHTVEKLDVFKNWLIENLRNTYGASDPNDPDEPGPYSIRSYLEYIGQRYN